MAAGKKPAPDFRAEFGEFTPNKSIDQTIHRCLEVLPEHTSRRIGKKILHDAAQSDPDAPLHIFRDLIVGAHLTEEGHLVDYERKVEGKTPDWSILREDESVECVLDVFTLEPSKHLHKNIVDKIDEKAGRYKPVATALQIPFVVIMFGHFFAGLFPDEVEELARDKQISEERPTLAGIYFMEDKNYFLRTQPGRLHTRYRFHYFPNPHATHPVRLPDGDWYRTPDHKARAYETSSTPF